MRIIEFLGIRKRVTKNGGAFARRFWRDRDGSVAIEFVALAIPFALLLFAILESCISFAGQQLLTNAAEDVARQLRTGQVRATGLTEDQVRDMICERIELVVADDCPGLKVDLRQFDTFSQAAGMTIVYTGSGRDRQLDASNFKFDPGKATTKNMLRVFYEWPVMTDLLRKSVSNIDGDKTLHFAAVTWQNEPFDD